MKKPKPKAPALVSLNFESERRRAHAWFESSPVSAYWLQELEHARLLVEMLQTHAGGAPPPLVEQLKHARSLVTELEVSGKMVAARILVELHDIAANIEAAP